MPKVIMVPTSHIASRSIEAVKAAIDREKPDCVAVELDIFRYHALKKREGKPSFRQSGMLTYLVLALFSYVQRYLGKQTGVFPGSEMVFAADYAAGKSIAVSFIDMDIGQILNRIKKIKAREKAKLLAYMALGFLFRGRGEAMDLSKVPGEKFVKKATEELKREFPGFYNALIADRDRFMANSLRELLGRYDTIVAVVGAGHTAGIGRELKAVLPNAAKHG